MSRNRSFLNDPRATGPVPQPSKRTAGKLPGHRSARRAACRALVLFAALLVAGVPLARADEPAKAPVLTAPKNVDQLRALEKQVQQVVDKVMPTVVGVRVGPGQGSGVLISPDGYVLTAGHVVDKPNQDVTFIFHDGKTAKGKTLGLYRSADAGLMKITDPGKWPCAEKGSADAILPGSWCIAIGHPFGYMEGRPPVVRVGRVLQAKESLIQTDCPLIAGDSGGPLFDLSGRVIGINSRIGGSTTMNFHVPINVFLDNWDRMAKGDAWEMSLPSRDGGDVKSAFRPLLADVVPCVVRVKCDGKEVALGTIVGPNGWIVTKASELKGKIVCLLADNRELEAKTVGVCPEFDLAMLKIDATGLPMIRWGKDPDPKVGQWVAAVGMQEDPLAIGVISVPRRKIPPPSGILGVMIEDGKEDDAGPVVRQIVPKSPAEQAGIKPGDVITHVNGRATENREVLVKLVKQHRPGETVKITVVREEETKEISVKLASLPESATKKRDLQNNTGVGMSRRHDDFPLVLQHDTVLRPTDCGGPLVDLSGKVVGINVARGGRTETFTVPVDALVMLMYDMMSGRLPPPKTEAELKAEADKKAAAEKAAKVAAEKAAAEKAEAEKKAAAEKMAREKAAAEKMAREKAEAEKMAHEKAEAEKKAAEAKAAKEAAEKAAREKAEAEKKAATEKMAREKAEAEKMAHEKAEAEKKAAEAKEAKEAAEKAAREKAEAEKKAPPANDPAPAK